MVRAILDGRKTQTRPAIKPQPFEHGSDGLVSAGWGWSIGQKCKLQAWKIDEIGSVMVKYCPHGKPGDRLWVRETHCKYGGGFIYRADYGDLTPISDGIGGRWKPPIHMPRWASRITLEITAVRVEQLQDISEADAMAEGAERPVLSATELDGMPVHPMTGSYADGFRDMWGSINGLESWAANPWVWVVEFRKVEVTR
jgi:hypothetical protein